METFSIIQNYYRKRQNKGVKMEKSLFSSNSDQWATPQYVFDELPEKSTIENDMTDYQCGMVDGRNQCINEITGEVK